MPTICPKMKNTMLRVYDSVENDPEILLLSHTIDPEYDTVGLLKDFAGRFGVESKKWHFVTGEKEEIYKLRRLVILQQRWKINPSRTDSFIAALFC